MTPEDLKIVTILTTMVIAWCLGWLVVQSKRRTEFASIIKNPCSKCRHFGGIDMCVRPVSISLEEELKYKVKTKSLWTPCIKERTRTDAHRIDMGSYALYDDPCGLGGKYFEEIRDVKP